MFKRFNDISIRDKLIVIVAGAVAVLTTAVLVSVWFTSWREVRADVHNELQSARQEFTMTEGEHLHEHALEAQAIAGEDELLRFLKDHDSGSACAWLSGLLDGKNAPVNPEDSFDLVALMGVNGKPLGVVLRGGRYAARKSCSGSCRPSLIRRTSLKSPTGNLRMTSCMN